MAEQTTQATGGGETFTPLKDQAAQTTQGALGIGGLFGAGTFTPSLTGGAAAPSEAGGDLSDRSRIHIAPVGVNLGAIMAPYQEGSPENGGYGLELMSRYLTNVSAPRTTALTQADTGFPMGLLIAGAGGLLLVLVLLRTRKGGR